MKVVINGCYGGFDISHGAVLRYWEIKGEPIYFKGEDSWVTHYYTKDINEDKTLEVDDNYWSSRSIDRFDPILLQVIEEMGESANGDCANLKIVTIPDNIAWHIEEYDGFEHIAEDHCTWE